MRKLRGIDELYGAVKGYGLVITNDIALETALNARISDPRIGALAVTPRHIARALAPAVLGRPTMSDLQLISAVSEETGLGFKQVYSEILNIREIRRHTADVRAYLSGRAARLIYESYSAMPTLENAMSRFDPSDPAVEWYFQRQGGVAVIGVDLFDDLDKHFIPMDFDEVPMFADEAFSIPEVRVVGNDRLLAENAADLVDPECPEDFAIVMCASSPIADAVRSSLYRRGLPFVNSLNVRDLAQIRDYLSFLSLSLSYATLRVRAVKELFSSYGGRLPPKRDGYLLSKVPEEELHETSSMLRNTMRMVADEGMTFGDVKDAIGGYSRGLLGMLLDELGVRDTIVTPKRLSEVRFAVDNVQELKHNQQIPESERTGVLLADCRNSVYVDKPVVIYLGMGEDWAIPIAGKRYIDAEEEGGLNAVRLEALVQQGQVRVYMANTTKDGKPAAPCMTFDAVEGRAVRSFPDLAGAVVRGRWAAQKEEADFPVTEVPVEPGGAAPFSKTSFDNYAACPRRYMLHGLLSTAEKTHTEFGNLIHEFAEFYACYPDVVRGRGIAEFANMVSDRYSGLSTPLMEKLDSDRIVLAMTNVMRYIDSVGARAPLNTPFSSKANPNRFMEALGLEYTSDACETDHRSASHPVHGIFDLYWGGTVTDYKTGRGRSAKEIREAMSLDDVAEHPEFQPLIYLALAMETEGAQPVFKQFYATDNDVDSLDPGFDIKRNVRTISVTKGTADDLLGSEEFASMYESRLRKALKGKAKAILAAVRPLPSDLGGMADDQGMQRRVMDAAGLKEGKKGRELAASALKSLAGLIDGGVACGDDGILVPFAQLEAFLARLDEMHAEMAEGAATVLPAAPRGKVKCESCEYFQACTGCVVARDGSAPGEEGDERAQRVPGEDSLHPRRHGRRRRGARHGEDPHDRRALRQPDNPRAARRRAPGRPPRRDDAHVHQERRRRDGGAHQEEAHRGGHDRGGEARPRDDLRRVLPVRRDGVPRGRG